MTNRLITHFGDYLKKEIRHKRNFIRGGVTVFEIVFADYEIGVDLLAWVREPIDQKHIEGMANPVFRCRFVTRGHGLPGSTDENAARTKVAAIFDNYWKVIASLGPAEERHGTMTSDEKRRVQ